MLGPVLNLVGFVHVDLRAVLRTFDFQIVHVLLL
jgi:hypothetical protein